MGAGFQRHLPGYLHPSQLFVDQGMHLALRPLYGEVILKLFERVPGDHGDLSDREPRHAAAQLTQRLSPVVISDRRPDDVLLHLQGRDTVVRDACGGLNTGRLRYPVANRLYLFDHGVVALVQLRQEHFPEVRGQIWSGGGVTGQHSEPGEIHTYCSPGRGVARHYNIIYTTHLSTFLENAFPLKHS